MDRLRKTAPSFSPRDERAGPLPRSTSGQGVVRAQSGTAHPGSRFEETFEGSTLQPYSHPTTSFYPGTFAAPGATAQHQRRGAAAGTRASVSAVPYTAAAGEARAPRLTAAAVQTETRAEFRDLRDSVHDAFGRLSDDMRLMSANMNRSLEILSQALDRQQQQLSQLSRAPNYPLASPATRSRQHQPPHSSPSGFHTPAQPRVQETADPRQSSPQQRVSGGSPAAQLQVVRRTATTSTPTTPERAAQVQRGDGTASAAAPSPSGAHAPASRAILQRSGSYAGETSAVAQLRIPEARIRELEARGIVAASGTAAAPAARAATPPPVAPAIIQEAVDVPGAPQLQPTPAVPPALAPTAAAAPAETPERVPPVQPATEDTSSPADGEQQQSSGATHSGSADQHQDSADSEHQQQPDGEDLQDDAYAAAAGDGGDDDGDEEDYGDEDDYFAPQPQEEPDATYPPVRTAPRPSSPPSAPPPVSPTGHAANRFQGAAHVAATDTKWQQDRFNGDLMTANPGSVVAIYAGLFNSTAGKRASEERAAANTDPRYRTVLAAVKAEDADFNPPVVAPAATNPKAPQQKDTVPLPPSLDDTCEPSLATLADLLALAQRHHKDYADSTQTEWDVRYFGSLRRLAMSCALIGEVMDVPSEKDDYVKLACFNLRMWAALNRTISANGRLPINQLLLPHLQSAVAWLRSVTTSVENVGIYRQHFLASATHIINPYLQRQHALARQKQLVESLEQRRNRAHKGGDGDCSDSAAFTIFLTLFPTESKNYICFCVRHHEFFKNLLDEDFYGWFPRYGSLTSILRAFGDFARLSPASEVERAQHVAAFGYVLFSDDKYRYSFALPALGAASVHTSTSSVSQHTSASTKVTASKSPTATSTRPQHQLRERAAAATPAATASVSTPLRVAHVQLEDGSRVAANVAVDGGIVMGRNCSDLEEELLWEETQCELMEGPIPQERIRHLADLATAIAMENGTWAEMDKTAGLHTASPASAAPAFSAAAAPSISSQAVQFETSGLAPPSEALAAEMLGLGGFSRDPDIRSLGTRGYRRRDVTAMMIKFAKAPDPSLSSSAAQLSGFPSSMVHPVQGAASAASGRDLQRGPAPPVANASPKLPLERPVPAVGARGGLGHPSEDLQSMEFTGQLSVLSRADGAPVDPELARCLNAPVGPHSTDMDFQDFPVQLTGTRRSFTILNDSGTSGALIIRAMVNAALPTYRKLRKLTLPLGLQVARPEGSTAAAEARVEDEACLMLTIHALLSIDAGQKFVHHVWHFWQRAYVAEKLSDWDGIFPFAMTTDFTVGNAFPLQQLAFAHRNFGGKFRFAFLESLPNGSLRVYVPTQRPRGGHPLGQARLVALLRSANVPSGLMAVHSAAFDPVTTVAVRQPPAVDTVLARAEEADMEQLAHAKAFVEAAVASFTARGSGSPDSEISESDDAPSSGAGISVAAIAASAARSVSGA
jgi:hypothetical protein